MTVEEKGLSLLGLAQKAGKLASGELPCENAIRSGQACLVVMSSDASAGTMKKFSNHCHFYEVPLITAAVDKQRLGHAIGRQQRSSIAVLDEGFAAGIQKLWGSIEA